VAVLGPSSAQQPGTSAAAMQAISGTVAAPAEGDAAVAVSPALLSDIVTWLSQNFDLPAAERLPKVAFLPPAQITALHFRGFLDHHRQGATVTNGAVPAGASDIVAVYEPASETIYLPEGWRGTTHAEMSVLVHEVVHHLQYSARLPYACPAEREKLAYAAQQRWLQRFDRSLSSEFGTDGFTLLIRTNCGF
jgi:hypothetical protein